MHEAAPATELHPTHMNICNCYHNLSIQCSTLTIDEVHASLSLSSGFHRSPPHYIMFDTFAKHAALRQAQERKLNMTQRAAITRKVEGTPPSMQICSVYRRASLNLIPPRGSRRASIDSRRLQARFNVKTPYSSVRLPLCSPPPTLFSIAEILVDLGVEHANLYSRRGGEA